MVEEVSGRVRRNEVARIPTFCRSLVTREKEQSEQSVFADFEILS